jgi:L-threonylcarbamoyladenylate synthase
LIAMHIFESESGPSVSGGPLPPRQLADRLAAGAVVLMPTDTLVALAACPAHAAQIWGLKQRPAEKPLILMAADLEQLEPVLGWAWRAEWLQLARSGWPGALTLVLPARGPWAEQLNPGGGSLGLRIPDCDVVRDLLRCTGPLATTSANPSGWPAAETPDAARRYFPDLSLLGPLPWPPAAGQASTVLAWQGPIDPAQGSGRWQVLRAGAFLPPELEP